MSFEIRNYNPLTDHQSVIGIASDNINKLVSIDGALTDEKRREYVRSEIEPALNNSATFKQVSTINEKSVGFITFKAQKDSLYGKIFHLAIHNEHQGAKLGSSLLQSCLNVLKEHGVQIAHLEITDDDLIPFYEKRGFKVLKYPTMKYGSAGLLGINMRESKGSLLIRSADFFRMRKPLIPRYVGLAGMLGVSLFFNSFVDSKKSKPA